MEIKQFQDTNYYVAKDGSVYRKVKQFHRDNSYSYVHIDRKSKLVHRLVGEVWLKNWDEKGVINHKDFNKQNNRVDNLECITYKENLAHYWRDKKE